MKLKPGFVISKAGDDYVAVPTGEAGKTFHGLVRNNSTAAFLLEQLKTEHSMDELVAKLLETYEVEEEQAQQDVEHFVDIIRQAGMLE